VVRPDGVLRNEFNTQGIIHMKNITIKFALAAAAVLVLGRQCQADIVISISFDQDLIVDVFDIQEGAGSVAAYLHFDAIDGTRGTDFGAVFDGFTYVIEAANSGADVPFFDKPITTANLNPLMQTQGWSLVDDSGAGAANQLAGNVNAPGGSGLKAPFAGMVLSMQLNTSALDAGDAVVFDPNLFQLASVSDGVNDFGGNTNYVFNSAILNVTAIPEPATMALLLVFGASALCLRRRRSECYVDSLVKE